jgi:hypothetical protein
LPQRSGLERSDFVLWHIAKFCCNAELGRYQGMADMEQASCLHSIWLKYRLDRNNATRIAYCHGRNAPNTEERCGASGTSPASSERVEANVGRDDITSPM